MCAWELFCWWWEGWNLHAQCSHRQQLCLSKCWVDVAATETKWSDHILNWVQVYEEQIIWHGLTLSHSSPIAPCLPSQNIHHNRKLLPHQVLQSYIPSFYNTLFLFQASVSSKTYLSNPIFPAFYIGHPHLQPQAHIPLSCFFGTSWDILQASSPTASPGAIQHQKPGCERQQHWETCPYRDSQNKPEQGNKI